MGLSDFSFHAEANLFTSVAFSKGWRQFKKSYLPLALLEQPLSHNLVLCSFHCPFTSACWATWLPAWIVERAAAQSRTMVDSDDSDDDDAIMALWLLHWRPVRNWHS
jgi:hypothetical protein